MNSRWKPFKARNQILLVSFGPLRCVVQTRSRHQYDRGVDVEKVLEEMMCKACLLLAAKGFVSESEAFFQILIADGIVSL